MYIVRNKHSILFTATEERVPGGGNVQTSLCARYHWWWSLSHMQVTKNYIIKIEAKNILSNHSINNQHHRVLAEGAMEESLEDTWEIKVLCESKTSSIWISHFERKTCHRQASSLFASGSLAGSRQPSNRWKMMIMSGGDGELSSYCQGTMSTLNAKSERTRFPTSWSGCTM